MGFLTEPAPDYGLPIAEHPGIRRIVAENPGPMTYHGTNTWLVDQPDGIAVIDPGPDLLAHCGAILRHAGRPITRILLTHTHPDHAAGTAALHQATGAPVLGWGTPWAAGFAPDQPLGDGEAAGTLRALHTPGHAGDHLCFAHPGGVLFSGDHVMPWSSTVVPPPPHGDMGEYMASLRLLLARPDTLYLSGHGPPLPEPQALVRALLGHRLAREATILAALDHQPRNAAALTATLYSRLQPALRRPAELTVAAHLARLGQTGRASLAEDGWIRA